jgi:hypothetical protein
MLFLRGNRTAIPQIARSKYPVFARKCPEPLSSSAAQRGKTELKNRAKPGVFASSRPEVAQRGGGQNAKIQSGAELNLLLQCEPTHDSNRQTTRGKDRINQQIRETERREIHHSEHPEEQISSE